MRLLVKQVLAIVLYYSGLLNLWETLRWRRRQRSHATILTYHCFLEKHDSLRQYLQPGICITPDHFDQQLAFLKHKYRLLSLNDYLDKLDTGEALPKRTVIITIDDGWRDNYDHAFPLLTRHETPATIFLTTDYIDTNRQFWFLRVGRLVEQIDPSPRDVAAALGHILGAKAETITSAVSDTHGRLDLDKLFEQLKELDCDTQTTVIESLEKLAEPDQIAKPALPRSTLTWDEVREMSQGGVAFGSHGKSHQIMTLLTPAAAIAELEDSRSQLAAAIGREIRPFAYPNGDYTNELAAAVKRAGYSSGLATGNGLSPDNGELGRYSMRRIGMHDAVSMGAGGRFSRAMLAWHLARFG